MKAFYIIWILTAAPDPWSARQIAHSAYATQEECTHQQITEMVTDRQKHQHWVWQCRHMPVTQSKRVLFLDGPALYWDIP